MKALPTFFFAMVVGLALVTVAAADDIYDNGAINGNTYAWTVNFGYIVSDSFTLSAGTSATGLSFGAWLFPGDTLTSAEVSITSQEFGGTTYFDGTVNFSQSGCFTNSFGFSVCTETGNFNGVALQAGTYWLNLQNANVPSGDPVYWDENSGPSLASENTLGTLPSEAFTLFGAATTTTCNGCWCGTSDSSCSPEPGTLVLFGSGGVLSLFGTGMLGLLGAVRKRLR